MSRTTTFTIKDAKCFSRSTSHLNPDSISPTCCSNCVLKLQSSYKAWLFMAACEVFHIYSKNLDNLSLKNVTRDQEKYSRYRSSRVIHTIAIHIKCVFYEQCFFMLLPHESNHDIEKGKTYFLVWFISLYFVLYTGHKGIRLTEKIFKPQKTV